MAISGGDYWGGNDPEIQDETNFRADYGPILQDRTHSVTWDLIYDAPFDRWMNASGALKHVVGGWQVAGILGAATGSALNVSQSSNYPESRPDYVGGDPYRRSGDRFLYLNTAAFLRVPQGQGGAPIRPGSLGKNALRAPSFWNLDLSLAKKFSFLERYALQFRADMFNATNSVRLGNPISDISNSDFGIIRSVASARTMQLGLRFTF